MILILAVLLIVLAVVARVGWVLAARGDTAPHGRMSEQWLADVRASHE